jgi:hypothetical protein
MFSFLRRGGVRVVKSFDHFWGGNIQLHFHIENIFVVIILAPYAQVYGNFDYSKLP